MAANNNTENKSSAHERIYSKTKSDYQQTDSSTSTSISTVFCFTNILKKFSDYQANILATLWKEVSAIKMTPSTNLV